MSTPLPARSLQVFRLMSAVLIAVIAVLLQQWLWPYIPSLMWLLLYPAVFFSAWIGGFWGGITSTVIAAMSGLYFFAPPYEAWHVQELQHSYSILIFTVMGILISITHEKLKRSQIALQKSNDSKMKTNHERLMLTLDSIHAGLWEWDVQTNQIFWSEGLQLMYGLHPDTPPSYDNWLASVHGDDRVPVVARLNDVVSRGREINLEWRVANLPDNQERWIMSNGQPIFDDQGNLILYRGIVLDITQRKRQEQILKERKQRLDFALSTLEAGAWELNLQNHTAQRTLLHDQIFGYQELLPEWTFEQFIQHVLPEDRDRVSQRFTTALQTLNDWSFECRIRRADGNIRWIYAKGRLKQDPQGRPVSMTGIVQDITERKLAAESLARTHALLDALMRQAPIGFAYFDRELRYVLINDSLAAINGLPAEAHIGKRVHDIVPTLVSTAESVIARILATGEPVKDCEFSGETLLTPGVTRYWNESWYPLYDSAGEITGFGAMVEDITERKCAENKLKEIDRRKDEFLAMLAHELRNPLAPISNAARIMKCSKLDEARLAWCRDVIDRQVEQLVRLVDDLLDVSRISRGKIELKKDMLEVSAVIQRAVETSQPLMEARRHAFSVQLPPEPVYIEGDLVRLSQVVSNLLNNAAKYTGAGGHITLSAETVDDDILIRVRDSGRGIDPSVLPNLFQLFYQVDSTIDRAEGGLGIGLALVKSLVAMHGGEVWATSAGRNQGSEFVVRLPALPPASKIPASLPKELVPAHDPLRILVVDDNRDAAQTLSLLLTGEGHTVQLTYDGLTGLQAALTDPPQVMLLDIGLPGMDGYTVARTLRRHPGLDMTHLVALSGYGREVDRERAQAAGFNNYLTKPVNFDELQAVLSELSFDGRDDRPSQTAAMAGQSAS
ncbi:MAG: PAS domain S-box protein [Methylobacter sp.]|uniref:hybrid sensor histidine kinase/response regulator n=1 Tax=Methylobacter sp. TaxID=2051955 RepID=UPI002585B56F|nr:PAS domain S-box protein [Methylobacter sp.]MCL7422947.1 PAS domain S-box protein [Methylobacter sp.]